MARIMSWYLSCTTISKIYNKVLILIIIIIIVIIIIITELYWQQLNLTISRMKIKQLVIFTTLNYTFENIYTILKTELYDHDKNYFTIYEY